MPQTIKDKKEQEGAEINTGEARLIKQTPLAKRNEVKEVIDEMKSSSVVLVKKIDCNTTFCIDYRKLNTVTKKDNYPLPIIDDLLDTLTRTKWFSTLYLPSGYWQEIADKEKTIFNANGGL